MRIYLGQAKQHVTLRATLVITTRQFLTDSPHCYLFCRRNLWCVKSHDVPNVIRININLNP
ncbi:hypothetical protein AB72_2003 [Escherichia coli 1-250-04_S1_C3]|nr:hypothetical protein AB72_2003 [Escherichia coli 1-250-04_S1_C3]